MSQASVPASRVRTARCRRGLLLGAGVVLVVVSLLVTALAPGVGADSRAERDQVRAARAALAGQIDVLAASDDQVARALRDLAENVRGQQAAVADAERAALDAQRRADESATIAEARTREADELRARIGALAVENYVNLPSDELFERFKAADATEAAEKRALLDTRVSATTDLIDRLRAARYEAEEQLRRAEEAGVEAERRRQEATARLAELAQAEAQQRAFADELEVRLNARLAEADALAAVDGELSRRVAAEQAALAEQLRRSTPPAPAQGASPPSAPSTPSTPPATLPSAPPPSIPKVPLRTVRGITVHVDIAGALESLLAAAASAGIGLGGSGYRDPAGQIALRRAHCGTSTYAIYQMPPSQCVPPTAIPGTSLHEQGKAIDFTWNGSAITSRDNPAFRWLAANAGRFGFYNLPSEPWHWSVNGS